MVRRGFTSPVLSILESSRMAGCSASRRTPPLRFASEAAGRAFFPVSFLVTIFPY